MVNGIINVYKEAGFTSHDVIAKMRGIIGFRHIGHTGTLDPMAEGVLPVCIGSATKVCDMLTDKVKEYEAEILFGTATDTEDITGNVTKTLPVFACKKDLLDAFPYFLGEILQTPPMYSAIKLNGQKLYDLAREGKEVEVAKRKVRIDDIKLLDVICDGEGHLQEAKIKVVCGKGTYIRSLCRDLGEKIGTCACMKSLYRTRTDCFLMEDSLTLSKLQELKDAGTLEDYILPIDKYFKDYDSFNTLPEFDHLVNNGNPIRKREAVFERPIKDFYRAYDSKGQFCGIYKFDRERGKFRPDKMFLEVYS